MDRYVTLVMHHGGKFVREPTLTYVDGEVDAWEDCDIDKVSIPTITELFCEHGYKSYTNCYWLVPDLKLEDGLRPLNSDSDVIEMFGAVEKVDEIQLYFESLAIVNPEHVWEIVTLPCEMERVNDCEELDNTCNEGVEEMHNTDEDEEYVTYLRRDVRQSELYNIPEQQDVHMQHHICINDSDAHEDADAGVNDNADEDANADKDDIADENATGDGQGPSSSHACAHHYTNADEDTHVDEDLQEFIVEQSASSSDTDETETTSLDSYGQDHAEHNPYNPLPVAQNTDEEDMHRRAQMTKKSVVVAGSSGTACHATKAIVKKKKKPPQEVYVNPFEGQGYETEELHTPNCSEPEVDGSKEVEVYPQFNPGAGFGEVNLELGMEFPTLSAFKAAVKDYTIHLGRPIVWVKNDKQRAKAICTNGCMWEIFCSFSNVTHSFQVKTFNNTHTCSRKISNKQAGTKWLAHKLIDEVRGFLGMEGIDANNLVKRKFNVNVNERTILRALKEARKMVEGTEKEQYAALWDYCGELKRVDPRGTIQLAVERTPGALVPNFDRLYICLEACKEGFKAACRPLIGLDGCFLKGYYGGILLSAVAQDGNNSFYPVAYAVVDLETKDTWRWFLTRLIEDIGNPRDCGWNFISDQQKGLEPALAEVCPTAPHRSCVMHIWKNFCKTWKSKELRLKVFMAAKSTTMAEFDSHMAKIRCIDSEAHKWLLKNAPARWVRGSFSTYTKNQAITSNMCEQFNKELRKFRCNLILTMLEEIRGYIMRKRSDMLTKIRKYKSKYVPMAMALIEIEKKKSSEWCPLWAGDPAGHKYEVSRGPTDKVVVDLSARTCSCRSWDLTGIPCRHACAAFASNNDDPDNVISDWYLTTTWLKAYEPFIQPLAGQDYWQKTYLGEINPPSFKRPAGRPKKNRSKVNDVPQDSTHLKRKYGATKCSKCGGTGHNTRTCKGVEPRKRQKKSKNGNGQPSAQEEVPVSQPIDSQAPPPVQDSQPQQQQGGRKKVAPKQKRKSSSHQGNIAVSEENVTSHTIQAATMATRKRFSTYLSSEGSRKGKEKLLSDI